MFNVEFEEVTNQFCAEFDTVVHTGDAELGEKIITANGVYNASSDDLDGYSKVTANVSNTYTASDEGKVVDNGALVSQTSATYTLNNTYDTTLINSVTVNVSGGSTPTLETVTKTYTPTTSQQTETITPSSGYDGIGEVDVTVNAIPSQYIIPTGTKSISSNGTGIDVKAYEYADVAVPNSYSAGDEGKVVSSGALVAQTAHADVTPTTSDQTIDTTTNNSIKVKGDADLVAANIKKDVEIFGVTGSYEGGGGSGSIEHGTFTPTERLKSHTITTEQEKSNFVVFANEGFSFSLGTAAMILMIYQGSYGVGTNNGGTATGILGSGQGTLTKSGNNFTYEATGTLGSSTRAWQAGVTYHWFAW